MKYHLTQLNISALREPIDSPLFANFVVQFDEINALAKQSDGFVVDTRRKYSYTARRKRKTTIFDTAWRNRPRFHV